MSVPSELPPSPPQPAELTALARLLHQPELITAAAALQAPGRTAEPLERAAAFRRQFPEVEVSVLSAALAQAVLRHQAAAKFGTAASSMFFTTEGLEQATRGRVAAHRAQRLHDHLDPGAAVVDLCCGIGGDLVALARDGFNVTGVDFSPVAVAMASANLSALGLAGTVVQADATLYARSGFSAVICDPARRTGRGRSFNLADYRPPWAFIADLLTSAPPGCVKVGPGIPHAVVPEGVEAEWVSEGGDLTEAALWSGQFATTTRRATVLSSAYPNGLSLTEADDPGGQALVAPGGPDAYLLEPDPAVIRAGLVTAVAAATHGRLIDEHLAYVTTDRTPGPDGRHSPFATSFLVREVLPFKEKALRSWVREHSVGTLEIKKRGVDVVPEQMRARLRPTGNNRATLVFTRVAGAGAVLVVERLG